MSATLPLPEPARSETPSLWVRLASLVSRRYRAPLLDGLTPPLPVRLLLADGSEGTWRQDEPLQPHASPKPAAYGTATRLTAIAYPEDRLLRRQLTLPDMAETEAAQAAELDAVTSSPFRSDDLVWGHRCVRLPTGTLQVDIVLASRKQVLQYLDQLEVRLAGPKPLETWVEVWAWAESAAPVVIRGFGEGRRIRRQARQRGLLCGLLFLLWGLLMGIAITPTAQLRLQAIKAVAAFDNLHQKTSTLVHKRESLSKTADQLAVMDEILSERVRTVETLGLLTRALPDDTSLLTLQIQGSKVRLTGQTSNTADLMQKLGGYPGIRDVKAPSAATRPLGTNKESFSIELELVPEAFRVAEPGLPASAATAAGASTSSPQHKATSP
ncbi:MAG: PilN domain-containing protein [Burkholderiaceae bacterium]|nr:PilN domain-containing protein [Burkholderiaceae bacterium]